MTYLASTLPETEPVADPDPESFQLTSEQKAAVGLLSMQCSLASRSPLSQVVSLQGGAGVGKSVTTAELVRCLESLGFSVGMAASTHVAAGVLRDAMADQGLHRPVSTLASVLGLREKRKNGRATFEPLGKSRLGQHQIQIIDEASMIDQNLFSELRNQQSRGHTAITVGDPAQLCPVDPERGHFCLSPALQLDPAFIARLETVHRYGGVLLELATELRGLRPRQRVDWSSRGDSANRIIGAERLATEFRARMQALAAGEIDPRDCRMLAYTNKAVDRWNDLARRIVYGDDSAPFHQGQILITRDAVKNPGSCFLSADGENNVDDSLLWGASATLTILEEPKPSVFDWDISPGETESFSCWELVAYSERSGGYETFLVLDPSEKDHFRACRDREARDAKIAAQMGVRKPWARYWDLVDSFANVQLGFASTVHRAQGCGFDTVLVDKIDICKALSIDHETTRSLVYTAVTRCRRELIVQEG